MITKFKKRFLFPFFSLFIVSTFCGGGKEVDINEHFISPDTKQKFALITITIREKEKNEFLQAKGHFFSYKGATLKDVLKGFNFPVLSLSEEIKMNKCTIWSKKTGLYPLNILKDATVELLDGGDISLNIGIFQLLMETLDFPEIASNIFGVIYEINENRIPSSHESYISIYGNGSGEIPSFSINSQLPSPFKVISIEKFITPDGESFLSIFWNNSDPKSDFFVIEFPFYTYDKIVNLVCICDDDGQFDIPLSKFSEFPEISEKDTYRIVTHRVKITQFFPSNMNEGWIVTKYQDEIKIKNGKIID